MEHPAPRPGREVKVWYLQSLAGLLAKGAISSFDAVYLDTSHEVRWGEETARKMEEIDELHRYVASLVCRLRLRLVSRSVRVVDFCSEVLLHPNHNMLDACRALSV